MSLIQDRAAVPAEMLAIFADATLLREACRFEAALARAQAAEGLLTATEADAIAAACASPGIDISQLAGEAAHAGTMAIALVRHLRDRAGAAGKKLHFGATSQDVADTVLMLQAKAGLAVLDRDLGLLAKALAKLAEEHVATPMLGRTLLQPALPITFGLKAANWLLAIAAARTRLAREGEAALLLQFGGATGTLAGLDGRGLAVAERLAAALGLALPPMPWHARRDSLAGLATALAIATGAVGKIARDISLMAQAEIGEAFEPKQDGRGGSSIMAHKRNATGCQAALSAALRTPGLAMTILAALPQEHERGLGGWQIEAPVMADLFGLTHGAVAAMLPVIEGLDVDVSAMQRNLNAANVGGDFGVAEIFAHRALAQFRKAD